MNHRWHRDFVTGFVERYNIADKDDEVLATLGLDPDRGGWLYWHEGLDNIWHPIPPEVRDRARPRWRG